MELGFCMISEAQKLHIDMNLKDESSMEKFGEKVYVPKFIDKMEIVYY
jgi:hypothetical protein